MAGVKGRSGRKSNANEEYKLATIEECWKLVRENIHNPELPLQFRVELAAKHTVKSIPTELLGTLNHNVTEMPTIQKHLPGEAMTTPTNRIAEFDIGSPNSTENT